MGRRKGKKEGEGGRGRRKGRRKSGKTMSVAAIAMR